MPISRVLDPGERLLTIMDRIASANFVVIVELANHEIDAIRLAAALARFQAIHPLLQARIVMTPEGALRFEHGDGSPIPLATVTCSSEDWLALVVGDIARRFETEKVPLARCRLVHLTGERGTIIGLTLHHAIADARTATRLVRELLAHYFGRPETRARREPEPSLHALFPEVFGRDDLDEQCLQSMTIRMTELGRFGPVAAVSGYDPQAPACAPACVPLRFDEETTDRLVGRCRAEGTTVSGALSAAQLIGKRRAAASDANRAFLLATAADMRPYAVEPPAEDALGNYVTVLASTFPVDRDSSFWGLARDIVADLRRKLARGDGHFYYAALHPEALPLSGPGLDAFADRVRQLPQRSMISNIGSIPNDGDPPELIRISFGLCPAVGALLFNAATTYRSRLTQNLIYDAAKLPTEIATQLAALQESALREAIA